VTRFTYVMSTVVKSALLKRTRVNVWNDRTCAKILYYSTAWDLH